MTQDTNLGKIEISPTAIANLASQAVLQCYGVVGLSSPTLREGIAELLHPWEAHRRGVEVRVVEDRIHIDLYVVIEYGTRVSEVAQSIIHSVKYNVEKALGMPVERVTVHVQGLRVSSPDAVAGRAKRGRARGGGSKSLG
ncbi:MAG: Asp23/Gls24 family envelope stress response protein [Chloroflexi bacterium]|nr:Asp23/Gls24 family envelope stress response protein [Chloroflexota bacterium]